MKAIIALEDGFVLEGENFGAQGERTGEVVFNTSMMGYQEILTDPSYKGQIVTMTYPLIGNYGVNDEDYESTKSHVEGFIVKENSSIYSNWRAQGSLEKFLKKNKIIGIQGVDTRALTRHIRTLGAMKSVISTKTLNKKKLVDIAKSSAGLVGRDLVKEVTCSKKYIWKDGKSKKFKVVVFDCGVKHNILRLLDIYGCEVIVVPATTDAQKIFDIEPDGVLLSNGPGDPSAVFYLIETVKKLLGKFPVFGICLGHQILGLALGGKTYKLKFGHRGGNQPIMNLLTKRVHITSENHGFAVDMNSLNKDEVEITHINLNDKTVEGMKHKKLPVFSVQFHPEASPGPHDSRTLFEQFIHSMKKAK
ncbi:MAG: glutamine-hydrolyzing carbamoyl-phosphate synthase small subunit [Candidatus Firestonebacteria bacterium]